MTLLTRWMAGQTALWRTFWLVVIPLWLLWIATGVCMVLGIGVEDPLLTGVIMALFALASVAMPVAAVALWRSASNYPQPAWWQMLLAIAVKLCAVLFGLIGALSVVGLCYLAYEFLTAALA